MTARRAIFLMLLLFGPVGGALAGVTLTDSTDRQVTLVEPARRIVSLAPHVTETLYAAGAGEYLVGAVNYSDYPAAARELPRVGSYDNLNIEAILAHDPDLVVAWKSGNPTDQIRRLRELGLTVYVTEPRRLGAISDTLERFGRLAGTQDVARAAAADFQQRLDRLRSRYSGGEPLNVFYQVWDDPLQTVSGEHVISDVIRGCGGHNVFAELPAIAPRVSIEAVLERDPEVVVASGMGEARPEWLEMWRQWPELAAMEYEHLFFVPPDILQRHSPRILEGMARMCAQLDKARRERGVE